MNLKIKKVLLNNFGSYAHAEVELTNRGFCLVSGKNNYKKDNAISNGAGKSFLWSAICFAITGETINGLKTGLKNIYNDDPESFVKLEFSVDNDDYSIIRYISPKSDMKIYKNAEDISGKGIRESEKKLGELLPDLTKDLIASTIIIGQGMPNKFSSFSPVGRKDLLEKLTKSDFMIEEVKSRLTARQTELSKQMRELEDSVLVNSTQMTNLTNSISSNKLELAKLEETDFDTEIASLTRKVNSIQEKIIKSQQLKLAINKNIENLNNQLLNITNQKTDEITKLNEAVISASSETNNAKILLESDEKHIKQEITKIENIKDICPTCGRKFENVTKPDTSDLKNKLSVTQEKLAKAAKMLQEILDKKAVYAKDINLKYNKKIEDLQAQAVSKKQELMSTETTLLEHSNNLEAEKTSLNKYIFEKDNKIKQQNYLKKLIEELEKEALRYKNLITTTTLAKAELQQHLDVLKKLDTLVKRDFRGYLLINIIKYLDKKAKEYCEIVFKTSDLDVYLDGNALDITYGGKIFDSLSGGEKQRVDLILQFAIRDMLSAYLNYSANILVLDEITDFLDKQSCDAVLKLVTEKLNQVESVFIISHHAQELNIPVDTELTIIKNTDGNSSVV